MKSEAKQKLHQSTLADLIEQKQKLSQELVKISPEIQLNRIKNLKQAKNIRHQIAIISTLITQKKLTTTSGE